MKKLFLFLMLTTNLFSKDYVLDRFFPEIKEAYFNGFGGIDRDKEGNIIIGSGMGGVMKITKEGHILARYPVMVPLVIGPFLITPYGVAVDSEGSIYGVWNIKYLGEWLFKLNKDGQMLWAIQTPNGGTPFYGPVDVAVDLQNNVYVVDKRNCRVVKVDKDGNFIKEFGGPDCGDPWTPNPSPLLHPIGIFVDSQGKLYVADSGNCRVAVFDQMGNIILSIGSEGTGPGEFKYPMDIVVDLSGNIYVSDSSITNYRIQKFNSNGQYIKEWGGKGYENGKFISGPAKLTIDGNEIYTVDFRRVQIFDLDGNFLNIWATGGTEEGKFWLPHRVEVDNSGNIYVLDTYNNRVQKFDRRGRFISSFGSFGTEEGKFNLPQGIGIDDEGNIYIADTGNKRIQKFSKKFEYLGKIDFGGEIIDVALDKNGYIYVLSPFGGLLKYDKNFNFIRYLPTNPYNENYQAYAICIDNTFNYYISSETNKVYKFDSEGNFIGFYGGYGEEEGKFKYIGDVAISNTGLLFVSDREKGITVFDSNFNFLSSFGDKGSDLERLWGFKSISVQNSGEVIVAEEGANRVSIWKPKKGTQGLIPAVARTEGGFGKIWRSDLLIFNQEDEEIEYKIKFHSAYGNLYEKEIKIQSKEAKEIKDIIGKFFGIEDDFGYLEVLNEEREPPLINSKVYTEIKRGKGTYGQGINGIYFEDTFTEIDEIYFNGLKNNQNFHTNLGLVNLRDSPIELKIEYFENFGNKIKEEIEILGPNGFKQKNFLLNELNEIEFYIKINSNTLDSRWFGYISIVDNKTGDGVFIRGQKRNFYLPEQWELIIPAVASKKGGYGSHWKTEIELTNGGEEDMEGLIEYYSSISGEKTEKEIEIEKGKSINFNDFLKEFFYKEEDFGFIIIKPNKKGLLVKTRIYTEQVLGAELLQPNKGSYGQEIPSIELFKIEGKEKYLIGAEEGEDFRTNLGIIILDQQSRRTEVVANEKMAKFKINLIKGGQILKEKEIEIEVNKLIQFNSFLKNLFEVEGENYVLKIIPNENIKYFAYISKIDNTTQDPIFIY